MPCYSSCAVSIISRSASRTAGRSALELLHRLAELGDLRPLVAEKQVEQIFQLRRVLDRAAHHLPLVLDQDGVAAVLEDDVVLRIALAEFLLDFLVEIVLLVLGLPIAERQPYIVKQRAID